MFSGLQTRIQEEMKMHEDFLQQLDQTDSGYYETKLPWKEDHVSLPTNKTLATA